VTPIRPGTLVGESATSLAALVHCGDVTPAEVVQAHLSWIAAIDPQLGAFQTVRASEALAEAQRLASRADLRTLPLAGVPVAIKDNVPVAGEPMRIGSAATPATPSPSDHPTVHRLRAAGAIIVGTTRVSELCVWPDCDTALGTARNPWNRDRTPGGSSGGSASAVGAAMVPLALGADGMGSIRIPAACCGVVGLKPGTGVVPADLGVSGWYGLAENGAITTTVEDAALMLSVLAGQPALRTPAPARPIRIAVSTRPPLPGVGLDPEIAAAVVRAASDLSTAGHTVEFVDPPRASVRSIGAIFARWFAGAAQDAQTFDTQKLEARTRAHVRLGRIVQRCGLVRQRDRENWRRLLEPFFRRFDLLVTPVRTMLPLSADGWSRRSWMSTVLADARFAPFGAAWNFAGYPAAVVPSGLHSSGMPLSVQLVAAPNCEGLILSVAGQLERIRPWRRHAVEIPSPLPSMSGS
jgi:amidase